MYPLAWNPEISGSKAIYLSINFYLSESLLKPISTESCFNALLILVKWHLILITQTFLKSYKDSLLLSYLMVHFLKKYMQSNTVSSAGPGVELRFCPWLL
jgi:hypothetical protein